MTTVLTVALPWGKFHATPWGHHVNEALVEWPPSPWRVLRALFSTWKLRAPHLQDALVVPVLNALAAPPAFQLPDHTEATTRHWLPDNARGKDKVIDAFAVVERGAMVQMRWDGDLAQRQREVLAELAALVPYLGRAESICELRLADREAPESGASTWLMPRPDSWGTGVRVLVAELPLDFVQLMVRTDEVRHLGALVPAGTAWVRYDQPEAVEPVQPIRRRHAPAPEAVRWALSSPALPGRKAAVAVGDLLRYTAMSKYGSANGGNSSEVLAGKDPFGTHLRGHGHAHYLAFDEDGDGLLDHAIAWAPSRFDQRSLRALLQAQAVYPGPQVRDVGNVGLGVEAVGDVGVVAPFLTGRARTLIWESHTPFAPPRHAHKNQGWHEFLLAEVNRELASRGLPLTINVDLLPGYDGLAFRRHRTRDGLHKARRAVGLRLEFAEPIEGPLSLGALNHFGLGLFVPSPST